MNSKRSLKLIPVSALLSVLALAVLHDQAVARISATATSAVDASALYGAKCALCHGKDGAGLPNWRAKGQPNLTEADWQRSHTNPQIADTIKNGKGKYMPPFRAKLSDEEINALVERVRALGRR